MVPTKHYYLREKQIKEFYLVKTYDNLVSDFLDVDTNVPIDPIIGESVSEHIPDLHLAHFSDKLVEVKTQGKPICIEYLDDWGTPIVLGPYQETCEEGYDCYDIYCATNSNADTAIEVQIKPLPLIMNGTVKAYMNGGYRMLYYLDPHTGDVLFEEYVSFHLDDVRDQYPQSAFSYDKYGYIYSFNWGPNRYFDLIKQLPVMEEDNSILSNWNLPHDHSSVPVNPYLYDDWYRDNINYWQLPSMRCGFYPVLPQEILDQPKLQNWWNGTKTSIVSGYGLGNPDDEGWRDPSVITQAHWRDQTRGFASSANLMSVPGLQEYLLEYDLDAPGMSGTVEPYFSGAETLIIRDDYAYMAFHHSRNGDDDYPHEHGHSWTIVKWHTIDNELVWYRRITAEELTPEAGSSTSWGSRVMITIHPLADGTVLCNYARYRAGSTGGMNHGGVVGRLDSDGNTFVIQALHCPFYYLDPWASSDAVDLVGVLVDNEDNFVSLSGDSAGLLHSGPFITAVRPFVGKYDSVFRGAKTWAGGVGSSELDHVVFHEEILPQTIISTNASASLALDINNDIYVGVGTCIRKFSGVDFTLIWELIGGVSFHSLNIDDNGDIFCITRTMTSLELGYIASLGQSMDFNFFGDGNSLHKIRPEYNESEDIWEFSSVWSHWNFPGLSTAYQPWLFIGKTNIHTYG